MVSTRLTTSRSTTPSIDGDRATETTETLADRRRRWSQLLRNQHYEPIIAEVLDDELSKYQENTAIGGIERVIHMRECALILSSAPSVLAAAIEGNLISRMLTDVKLQREYAVVQQRAHEQPSIYAHFLADELGTSPTPNQYLLVRDIVSDYLSYGSTSAYAYHLDNITRPTVTMEACSLGHRKYLQTKSNTRSMKRVDAFQRFCSGILARWISTPTSLRDTPFPYPPGECGYSISSHARLAQHRAHNSSNYIMNLVEDIFTHLHRTGTLSQHFIMHPFIIYLIFRPRQAAIAEVFCSGLLQVWVDDGGGFNACPAGLSVASAKRVTGHEWQRHVRSARDNSPVVENMRGQMERVEQWRRALDWEEVLEGDADGGDEEVDGM